MENGDYCIVRGDRSGVFVGNVTSCEGQKVTINNCRRIWRWNGAITISELAKMGTTNPSGCKFSVSVDELILLDAIEINPCTEASKQSLEGVGLWII